jgi:hypothetical protein
MSYEAVALAMFDSPLHHGNDSDAAVRSVAIDPGQWPDFAALRDESLCVECLWMLFEFNQKISHGRDDCCQQTLAQLL